MHRSPRPWLAALFLVLTGAAPAPAAPLFAQNDGPTPILEYGVGLVAAALVLLVVCWPAKREQ